MNYLFGISGRIGRLKWWGGQLIIISIIATGLIMAGGLTTDEAAAALAGSSGSVLLIAFAAFVLCVWINVAVTIKRYHDRNKSGWWFFCGLIPFVGGIWQLIECGFLSGTPGGNEYGPPAVAGGSGGLDAEIAAMQGVPKEKANPFAFLKGSGEAKAKPVARQQSTPVAPKRTTRINGKPVFGQRGV